MTERVLAQTDFAQAAPGWSWPGRDHPGISTTTAGTLLSAEKERPVGLSGDGVHTVNGDSIELVFQPRGGRGTLRFGYSGGAEHAIVSLDLGAGRVALRSSDWTAPQPIAEAAVPLSEGVPHRLVLHKSEGSGRLVKNATISVHLDGEQVLRAEDVNILPEIGVAVGVEGGTVLLQQFTHRGAGQRLPEYLHLGAWQMLNLPSIPENLASLKRGIREAAERGVQLLVTPETSLTGLYPTRRVTQDPAPVAEAERELQQFLGETPNAPHLIVGLPEWRTVPGHAREKTRYNVSRLYAPDGGIVSTHPKIHSCETEFWHGYRLHEFDVCGVPITMHICHDGRYPEVWTLPVMFGARVVLHPSNPVDVGGRRETVDRFEAGAQRSTSTSHAFLLEVNGAGGTFIAGPQKHNNLLAVAQECRRDNPDFPLCGQVQEGLVEARIRVHDAFGYWPVRSFRASEEVARAYRALYEAWGGTG